MEQRIRGSITRKIEYQPPNTYHHKTVETCSDRELKNKLCGFGCENCEVFDMCRIGQEWIRRQFMKG